MNIIQAIVLGLVQGLTEFIPVSSSGHLVLAHHFLRVTETGLTFDIALHLGTLMALLIYFHKDLWGLARAILTAPKGKDARLAWLLAAATLPAVIAGVLLEQAAESAFRSPVLVAVNLFVVALIMIGAEEFYHRQVRKPTKLEDVRPKQALVMGLSQAAALMPGVSRSGSTIMAGLFMGMDRVAATRFSFLLGIPITAGAIAKKLTEPEFTSQFSHEKGVFIVGILTAFVSGLLAIRFLLQFLARHSLHTFAYYRIALATIVIVTFVV